MDKKPARMKVPKFATEAEEARWWDNNTGKVETRLLAALRTGTAQRGTAQGLTRESRKLAGKKRIAQKKKG